MPKAISKARNAIVFRLKINWRYFMLTSKPSAKPSMRVTGKNKIIKFNKWVMHAIGFAKISIKLCYLSGHKNVNVASREWQLCDVELT